MTSAQSPNMLPAAHALIHAPAVVTIQYPRTLDLARSAPAPLVTNEVSQHSPLGLYTLHASLLI
jgi:hypothetical protein